MAGEAGAILGRADPGPLRAYARAIGLAFQIADDILDVTGDSGNGGQGAAQGRRGGQGDLRLAPRP
jgi:farnesyl diphosphate synthase